jgi:predicted metal-dependent TIM-barrel fold hydrolase
MNHPEFIVNASLEDMVDFADQGVVIEHSYALVLSGELKKEYLVEMIRRVGAERTTIGSDLGQKGNPYPVEGLKSCIRDLLDLGIKDEEIDLVLRKNPAKLIGLD